MKDLFKTHTNIVLFAVLFSVLFAYLVFTISPLPLDFDEILSWDLSTLNTPHLLTYFKSDTQLPLYYLILKLCTSIWGELTDQGLRLLSFFMTLIGSWFLLQTNQNHSRILSFLTMAILITSHPFISIFAYARPYALMFLLICMSLKLTKEKFFSKDDQTFSYAEFLLLFSLGLTHYLGFFFVVAHLLSLLALKRNYFRTKSFYISATTFTPILIFFLNFQLRHIDKISWIARLNFSPIKTILYALPAGYFFTLFYIFFNFKKSDPFQRYLSLNFLTSFLIFICTSLTISPLWINKYFIIFIPGFFLLTSITFEQMRQKHHTKLIALIFITSLGWGFSDREDNGIKKLIHYIGENHITNIACISPVPGNYSNALSKYSIQLNGKSICDSTQTSSADVIFSKFNYLILSRPNEKLIGRPFVDNWFSLHKPIVTFGYFELYKLSRP